MLSTLIHLRLPFFIFLLPIFLFGALAAGPLDWGKLWQAFFILHLLVYPASNGFNSYYDKDQGSIGGIKAPPPVHKSLLAVSLSLDAVALVWAWILSPWFALGILIYGMASKAYSWPGLRLKRRPWGSWLAVALGQGSLTFLLTAMTVGASPLDWTSPALWWGALLTALFLGGGYPLTQVYQHEEDSRRGDTTLSLILGIRGTFLFSGGVLALSALGFALYFYHSLGWFGVFLFLGIQTPTLVFFLFWMLRAWKDPLRADFFHTMVMNLLSSGLMNLFFGVLLMRS